MNTYHIICLYAIMESRVRNRTMSWGMGICSLLGYIAIVPNRVRRR